MKRIKSILVLTIILLFSFFPIYNYVTYKSFSLKKIFSKPIIFGDFNGYTSQIIDSNEIDSNRTITTETNVNAGIKVYTYNLQIKDLPNDILTLTLNFRKKNPNLASFQISAYSSNKATIYGEEALYNKNNNLKSIAIVNNHNVDEIIITAIYKRYNSSTNVDENVLSLQNIIINDFNDMKECRNDNILLTLLIEIFIIILYLFFIIMKKFNLDNYIIRKVNKIGKTRIFIILGITIGSFFSILFPLYQIPDEKAHINMIYSELNQTVDFESISNHYGDTLRIINNYHEKVNLKKYFDFSKKLNNNLSFAIPKISIIRHLPQATGIIIGELFNLPIFMIITICEVLATAFYIFICSIALKIIPFKKNIMMFCMLLPICLQQMGSFSYDVVLIPMCFLFIAYIMHLKFSELKINILDFIKILFILVVIFICKIPYVLLGLLLILLPLEKIDIRIKNICIDKAFIKKYKILLIIFLVICGILTIFVMNKISYGRVLLAMFIYPIEFTKMLFRTINTDKFVYLNTVTGEFGWLDTPVSKYYIIFIITCGVVFNFMNCNIFNKNKKNSENKFKKWESIFLILFFAFMVAIVILSMYEWTLLMSGVKGYENFSINQIGQFLNENRIVIGGVQGRYFVPLLPILFLPIFCDNLTNKLNKFNPIFLQILYYVIMIIYMIIVVLYRYWL